MSEETFDTALSQLGQRQVVLVGDLDKHRVDRATIQGGAGGDDAAAFICYTSGTDRRPERSQPHAHVLERVALRVGRRQWHSGPTIVCCFHFRLLFTGGLAVWLFTYWAGGCVVSRARVSNQDADLR